MRTDIRIDNLYVGDVVWAKICHMRCKIRPCIIVKKYSKHVKVVPCTSSIKPESYGLRLSNNNTALTTLVTKITIKNINMIDKGTTNISNIDIDNVLLKLNRSDFLD